MSPSGTPRPVNTFYAPNRANENCMTKRPTSAFHMATVTVFALCVRFCSARSVCVQPSEAEAPGLDDPAPSRSVPVDDPVVNGYAVVQTFNSTFRTGNSNAACCWHIAHKQLIKNEDKMPQLPRERSWHASLCCKMLSMATLLDHSCKRPALHSWC